MMFSSRNFHCQQITAKMKVLLLTLCSVILCCAGSTIRNDRSFPEDFQFGVATAAYQIEGAWNEGGKSENIWDRMIHTQNEVIEDVSNADVAADSYRNYKRDVEMMRELGVDTYRFSFAWTRILPSGFSDKINQEGVDFYNKYINEMLKYNITPMATIYHWDLPQNLQDLGGFSNPLITEWYEDYARVVFELFGDRVKLWITFNEPKQICYEGYATVRRTPTLNASGIGEYLCAKNLVISHAKGYHLYQNEFKHQGGKVGFATEIELFTPMTDSEEDLFAAELKRQADYGLYTEPIFGPEGGFPKDLAARVAEKSTAQGYPRSRLPEFTEEERKFVRGTSDFFGLNHYVCYYVSASEYLLQNAVPSILDDINVGIFVPKDWEVSVFGDFPQAPDNIRQVCNQLKYQYGDIDFYITENGIYTYAGLEDDDRVRGIKYALDSVLNAIDDGVKVKGYMAWSLMDNFEWMYGYVRRFGLYDVDLEDPARTRTPKKSAFVYKQIVKTRKVDLDYEPTDRVMTIDEGH